MKYAILCWLGFLGMAGLIISKDFRDNRAYIEMVIAVMNLVFFVWLATH